MAPVDLHGLVDADTPPTADAFSDILRQVEAEGGLDLPLPGAGATMRRWETLAALTAADVSLGRLAEGHVDALAILAEAGAPRRPGLYGVFAARGPGSEVRAERTGDGWRLTGRRRYCSGARSLDRALVDVDGPSGPLLLDLTLAAPGVTPLPGTWPAVGMAATDSLTVVFDGVEAPVDAQVGASGFYTRRPGFWHGGAGVAACWWGGAVGLVRATGAAVAGRPPGDARRRAATRAAARAAALRHSLSAGAAAVDAAPDDVGCGRRVAGLLRHLVHDGCREILDGCAAAGGTTPLVTDPVQARRFADLPVYLTQHRGAADLDALDPLDPDDPWR